MKIIESKPVSISEAKDIMIKREKGGEMNYEQKLALEHLKLFTKLKASEAKKIAEEITYIIKMSPETLIQIINILPKNADELRMIFASEKFSLQEDEVTKILDIVAKFR